MENSLTPEKPEPVGSHNSSGAYSDFIENRAYWLLPVLLCLIITAISLKWYFFQIDTNFKALAIEDGRVIFQMVENARLWNARHGGVYVVITDETTPNPYLEVKDRDVVTTNGMKLTLVNPAYMTRQMSEVLMERNSIMFHITSLKPIRPQNSPDTWESAALRDFEGGITEKSEMFENSVFRYMAPLRVKDACLKCHQNQGYKVGDIRGGISVTVPVDVLYSTVKKQKIALSLLHIMVFLSISAMILLFMSKIRSQWLKLRHAKVEQDSVVELRTREIRETNEQLTIEINERRHTEEILSESETKYRSLIQSVQDGIISTDENGVIISFNRGAEAIFGYKEADLTGKHAAELIPSRLQDTYKRAVQMLQLLGDSYFAGKRLEFEGHRKDGTEFPCEVSIASWKIKEDRFYVAIVRDITERKHMENQISASLHEKEVLLREIHHRVKNNMQIITSLLNLQNRYLKDQKDIDIFTETKNRIKAMSLVHEKLYQSETLSKIDFNDYVRNLALGLFRSYGVSERKINLKVDVPSISFVIDTVISCGLVINELISNSIKYAFPDISINDSQPPEREIGISLHIPDDGTDSYKLLVWDNGVGIPQESELAEHKSLGLQLVHSIVENQLQGQVIVERKSGTKFILVFKENIYKQRL
ncbi:PAS domain S-box protein [Candidatus Magnetomonas plexicatena]|uniref:PAS domain S-box protein n=1 Tax=Candidatus Magnetomonas plexicatena TaxID=2552947 RepID=UPI001C74A34A|nr:DUF3365 domain-containing protein [Nitrospirales bacterium LBB_01]